MTQAVQTELGFEAIDGSSYEIAGNRATWEPRRGDGKVIDLQFRRKKFEITKESRGGAGNERFLLNGYTQPDGKLLRGRSVRELVKKLERFGTALIRRVDLVQENKARVDERFDRLEKKIGRKVEQPRRKARSPKRAKPRPGGPKVYFNPFVVDWRSTKEFIQVPNWALQSSMTPMQVLIYARLLFPLAGEGGFCRRFDKHLGVIYELNCGSLAKLLHRGRDTIEETVRALQVDYECIELIGCQGQKKTLKFLQSPLMSETWVAACLASGKKPDVAAATSGKNTEANPTTSGDFPEVASYKTNPENESSQNESPLREPSVPSRTSEPDDRKGIRAKSRDTDSEKRRRGDFIVPRDAYDDPLWHLLWDTCGGDEMHNSGTAWAIRFGLERETVETILRDLKESVQKDGKKANPAAWLSKAWKESPASKRERNRNAKCS